MHLLLLDFRIVKNVCMFYVDLVGLLLYFLFWGNLKYRVKFNKATCALILKSSSKIWSFLFFSFSFLEQLRIKWTLFNGTMVCKSIRKTSYNTQCNTRLQRLYTSLCVYNMHCISSIFSNKDCVTKSIHIRSSSITKKNILLK